AMLRRSGIARRTFAGLVVNASTSQHRNLKELELDCTGSELADLKPAAMLATIFSTQCLPGDLAMALLTLQDCILAQEWTKALVLHQSLLQLAFFAADCLDEGYWGFSVRDVAVEQARMIWEMAQ
ncbi:unnamed protein product, partial [Polarella glacialis]